MPYIGIGLVIMTGVLAARIYLLKRVLKETIVQMEEIKESSQCNRQLKAFTTDPTVEKLFHKINQIYEARQQERIIYQRRETQIRREIENISHDLRTPLTSILGYVELIQDEQTKDTEKKEYLEVIKKRAKLLQGFIQDFYELSRIEAEDYPILLVSVPIQSTLSEVVVAYYHEFDKRKLQVEVSMGEMECMVTADQLQLNRILNNLVQNALKYAGKYFKVSQFIANGECIIQFINDSNQLTSEELQFIFDRFYTGDITRNNQSTGLGLTISKLLLEKMKGRMEARLEGDVFIIDVALRM